MWAVCFCVSLNHFVIVFGLISSVLAKRLTGKDTRKMTLFCFDWDAVPSVLWHCWLGIRKSIRPVKIEWWGVGVVICLERGADRLHMVQLMPQHPKTPSSLALFKSRLVLPFCCRLTQVVLEKRLLNGCSSSSWDVEIFIQSQSVCRCSWKQPAGSPVHCHLPAVSSQWWSNAAE